MPEDFDPANAIAVSESPEGTQAATDSFDIDNADSVQANPSTGMTPWDDFSKFQADLQNALEITSPSLKPGEKSLTLEEVNKKAEFPSHQILNNPVGFAGDIAKMAGDVTYMTFGGPIVAPDAKEHVQAELEQLSAKHPVGSIIAGTVPFIATAPLFPASLLGLTAQFAAVSASGEVSRQAGFESVMTPASVRIAELAKETSKGALMGPIWHFSGALQFLGRPFTSALTRAGARGAGTAGLETVYGTDLTQAFKDGGVMTALSLIFESPALAKTIIGQGIIKNQNKIYADMAVKAGWPEISLNPESPVFKQQILDMTTNMAKNIKGVDKPQIVSATVKLANGEQVHGSSHENALEKIQHTKETSKEITSSEIPDMLKKENSTEVAYVYGDSVKRDPSKVAEINKKIEEIDKQAKEAMDKGDDSKAFELAQAKGKYKEMIEALPEEMGGTKDAGKRAAIEKAISKLPENTAKSKLKKIEQLQNARDHFEKQGATEKVARMDELIKKNELTAAEEKAVVDEIMGSKGPTHEEGYTLMEPNGETRFVSAKQAKEEFGINESKDVAGLNESQFLTPPKLPEVVNPETLKKIKEEKAADDKIKESKAFQRAREKYETELKEEPLALYSKIGIVDQMAKAFHIVEKNPEIARKINYGMEEAPVGVRESAVSIAYAETMRESGNWKEYANAVRSRSLRQTERGQEIVLERAASTNVNDPQNFIKQVLEARMELVDKKAMDFSFKEKPVGTKAKVTEKIKGEARSIKDKFLDKKKMDMEEAQRIIDSLIC